MMECIKAFGVILMVLYAGYIIVFDRLFGMVSNDRWRVKPLGDKYIVQTRNILSPFWDNYGMGDIIGMDFSLIKFDTIEEAKSFIAIIANERN